MVSCYGAARAVFSFYGAAAADNICAVDFQSVISQKRLKTYEHLLNKINAK